MAISGYMTQIVGKAIDPLVNIQQWFATRTTAIVEFFTIPRDVQSLRDENATLKNEVSQLQAEILQLNQQLAESEILYALLDYAREAPSNKYVAASVIGKDPSPFLKYIILDHGSDDGIRKGMPVVTQQGLVGKIDAVTATAARVQLISDPGSVVNVRLEESVTEAQVVGSVTGDLSLEMVGSSVTLNEGELAITSGLGGSFPANILVGQILSIDVQENALFQHASIQPAVDFATLKAVLIITNFIPVEIQPLIPVE